MFSDWDDDEWCNFDNYMISCLSMFLKTGLVKSKFVNLRIRHLSAETCHEFIEWCGLINGTKRDENIVVGAKIRLSECYQSFVSEYPDYGPKSKMTISRAKFNKWMVSYARYISGSEPEEDRDMSGRWMRIKPIEEINVQLKL